MEDKAHGTPAETAPGGTTNAAVILRVLRVCLHSGFAVLLLVAVARLAGPGLRGADWLTLGLALVLAAVYLLGTVLEKLHSTDPARFDPRPYSPPWLGTVCLLWLLLMGASADFVWLAFPIFFLQLHVLPLRLALPAIALSTVLVIVALWFHNTGADGGASRSGSTCSCRKKIGNASQTKSALAQISSSQSRQTAASHRVEYGRGSNRDESEECRFSRTVPRT